MKRVIPRPETGLGSFIELVVIVALAVGLAWTIQAFLIKPYRIPSGSMIPTLEIGQRVLVSRVNYHFSDPDVGDIVVFHPPAGADPPNERCADPDAGQGTKAACDEGTAEPSEETYIKRIVAGPGDRLYVQNGHPVVDGVEAEEDFTRPCNGAPTCDLPEEIEIPDDQYFMMGDNRGSSDDSRVWGPVPRDEIIGQAFFTYWPPDRLGVP